MPPNHSLQKNPGIKAVRELNMMGSIVSSDRLQNISPAIIDNNGFSEATIRKRSSVSLSSTPYRTSNHSAMVSPVPSLKQQRPSSKVSQLHSSGGTQPVYTPTAVNNSSFGGYGNYGNGGYANGGMGMGMGMGMMGMGYPGMYGMGFNPLMMGPLSFLSNINYMILSVGQFISMLGMSSSMFVGMFQSLVESFRHLEVVVRQSPIRKWFQKKCKKSAVFRFLLVVSVMAIVGTASKLVRDVLKSYISQWGIKTPLITTAATTVESSINS